MSHVGKTLHKSVQKCRLSCGRDVLLEVTEMNSLLHHGGRQWLLAWKRSPTPKYPGMEKQKMACIYN